MEQVKASDIAKLFGSCLDMDAQITDICTDSRQAAPGSLFVAIPGERVDGHDYVNTALEKGAGLALVERSGDYPPGRTILVKNTVKAMLELAAWYRTTVTPHVIAITGSVGKTTTKDMIAAVLSSAMPTIKTIGNQNNEIGAPRTILSIARNTQAAVIEMGMCGFGEIDELARAAKPEIGVITNVGVNHLEQLGSRENILKAKLELAENLPEGAPLLLCADNDLLEKVEIPRLSVIYYGLDSDRADLRGSITGGDNIHTTFTISWQGSSWNAVIPGTGRHLVQNALAAFWIGTRLGLSPEQAIAALSDYRPSGMRQKPVEKYGITIVEDCYNASPDSMAAALTTLGEFHCTGRRYAVLSDMLELGSMEQEGHLAAGRLAAKNKLDGLFVWGDCKELYAQGAMEAGIAVVEQFDEKSQIAERLIEILKPGDVVWFKASRGKRLEEALTGLYDLMDKRYSQ